MKICDSIIVYNYDHSFQLYGHFEDCVGSFSKKGPNWGVYWFHWGLSTRSWASSSCLIYSHWSPHMLVIISDLYFSLLFSVFIFPGVILKIKERREILLTWGQAGQSWPRSRPTPPACPGLGYCRGVCRLGWTWGRQWTASHTRQGIQSRLWAANKEEMVSFKVWETWNRSR